MRKSSRDPQDGSGGEGTVILLQCGDRISAPTCFFANPKGEQPQGGRRLSRDWAKS